ncbi:MAG: bifunctional glutamate N-acetyltransferase/amino-acid acetyltransferase ArgJ [Spirochaetaceae bacterium]|nr:MAG: bifunctional glutamate N-acetyltransferase/amino-acid acetyltransferase ArgJ [Spirochaetaceae bacterium]
MESFTDEAEYHEEVLGRSVLPPGFRAATTTLTFVPSERPTGEPYKMNLATILLNEPSTGIAGVFTRNRFPGAPVVIARERMKAGVLRAVLINNKISNVCSRTGVEDARVLCSTYAAATGIDETHVVPVSTGIIGWRLPIAEMTAAIPALIDSLHEGPAADVAHAIMTTDSFPKVRSATVGSARIVAIAKGAGMIEPNLATMLVFILTDADIDRDELQTKLEDAVRVSFNRISVDSDMSTSDMVLALSSRRTRVDPDEFAAALTAVCSALAEDVVRNGEGAGHVIKARVSGVPEQTLAVALGKAVVNSPLVKTAVYGNDPNVGRIVSSLGDYLGNHDVHLDVGRLEVRIGDDVVFTGGAFDLDKEKETRLAGYIAGAALNPRLKGFPQHNRTVDFNIDFHSGNSSACVIGSDLSDEYVHENADYRS